MTTPEQDKDIQDRKEAFARDFGELQNKHQIKFVTTPHFALHPDKFYVVQVVANLEDTKYAPVPSPLQDIIKEK